ncbi:Adenylylsulfate kinase and related kinase [Hahella chejuensis KCTC 2396]|uniref:Adenylyl-sulfate kinase n=1 Tax=Hahella chejuensis (strain KCTC 2396) TaxID=349521 RepID=Q2SIK1_HAHCH|nr:adenylyl-sulfate kinase [Hahella chejuensis]ABC29523.1 Adenylylsulfate kinase and related kinase [Hahella chejuensis KCTC 2396]
MVDANIVWQDFKLQRQDRAQIKGQKPCLIWFTGLSGSGKSTLSNALDIELHKRHYHTYVLDGDNIRHGLNKDLSFSDSDRIENIRRVAEASKLLVDAGIIVMTAFISPFKADREMVKALFGEGEFTEVFVNTPLHICEQRDPKGLYQKARRGDIKNFTGIDSPYEPPESPDIMVDTSNETTEESIAKIISYLEERKIINPLRNLEDE